MARSLKKGPFIDAHLAKKVETVSASGKERSYKNMVSSFYNFS